LQVDLDHDPRWRRLHARAWICPGCGSKHRGLFDLACDKPDVWQGAAARPNSEIVGADDILTEDFCVLGGEHFFVRCVLQLPILGRPETFFGFGTWATLSKKNFDRNLATFDSGRQGRLGPWFGWFSNRLMGYPDTLNLKCQVHPRDGRQRPYIELDPTEHPLAIEQQQGIAFDRLLEIYALYGHDLRDVLSNAPISKSSSSPKTRPRRRRVRRGSRHPSKE
jgi:hypothetical protein